VATINKFQAMEVFTTVVEHGSFVRAADTLDLPKATVTRLIQALERQLGVKLLHRSTRQVSVTPDGALFYERCARILGEVREAEESMSRAGQKPSGLLRVDTPKLLAGELMSRLPEFLSRYPDIQLEFGSSNHAANLVEANIDCSVHTGKLPDSDLVARRVGNLNYGIYASPAYIAGHGRPLHPDDLERHRSIGVSGCRHDKAVQWEFSRGGERVRAAVPMQVAVNDSKAALDAAVAGLGLLQTTHFAAARAVAAGLLEPLLPAWQADPVALHVVYPHNRHLSVKVRVFVEWMAELFAGHHAIRRISPAAAPGAQWRPAMHATPLPAPHLHRSRATLPG